MNTEDGQAFMERIVRERAVAPASPGLPRLSNQERRSWWHFCLGMHDFIQALIRERLVDGNQASQLAAMQWLMLKGTYVFATPDPTLRDEQHRYVQICVNVAVAFAVIVDEPIELQDMCTNQYALGPSKIPAISEALLENQLLGWRDWRDAASPIAWVKGCTETIHERNHKQGGVIKKRDALSRTSLNNRATPTTAPIADADQEDRISVEEVAEIPGEVNVGLSPRLTAMPLQRIIAAIHDDDELRDYIQLRFRGFGPREAWERLGCARDHGQAIDRRFRRVRQKIKATGFEYQPREIERVPGISDASCMVVKERLRIQVPDRAESTLSGRVVYEPRAPGAETD